MYRVRAFEEKDLDAISEINFFVNLNLRYNQGMHEEDACVAVDEEGTVVGVGTLSYDATFYYIEKEREDIPLYCMLMELCIEENLEDAGEVAHLLTEGLKEKLMTYKKRYPDKKICMRSFVEDNDKEEMQFYLDEGFSGNNIIWVMGFDLTKEIPEYEIPQGITIDKLVTDDAGIKEYLEANALGYGGVQDSEDELRFRVSDERVAVYAAKDNDKIAASVTTWPISGGRSATENIFTIPDYRKKNIGRATVAYALKQLKESGETLATLTCVGDNLPAIAMYRSIGFEVKYLLMEMHYTL